MHPFKNFIIMEHIFCISRPYLIENHKVKIFCDIVLLTVTVTLFGTIIWDFFSAVSLGYGIVQGVTGFELLWLAYTARYKEMTFKNIERLDEKFELDGDSFHKLNARSNKLAALSIISVILDVVGLKILALKKTAIFFLCVVFTAHEAELAYVSLLAEAMNTRLSLLKTVPPNIGSRGYGYLLIATSHLSEHYTARLLLLLGGTLFTTVTYQFVLILADSKIMLYLSLYLIWRETRSMYSLWLLCSAVTRSNTLCNELALHLIGKLTVDKNISKAKNHSQYKVIQRWYSVIECQQPQYVSGSVLQIGLSTPILLLDLSINYMLIIVQMYLAYK